MDELKSQRGAVTVEHVNRSIETIESEAEEILESARSKANEILTAAKENAKRNKVLSKVLRRFSTRRIYSCEANLFDAFLNHCQIKINKQFHRFVTARKYNLKD